MDTGLHVQTSKTVLLVTRDDINLYILIIIASITIHVTISLWYKKDISVWLACNVIITNSRSINTLYRLLHQTY